MEIENKVTATLHDVSEQGHLPDDFAERVVRDLPPRPLPHAKWRAGIIGGATIIGLLFVSAAFVVPVLDRPSAGSGAATVVSFSDSGLALSYPSTWHVTQSGLSLHYEHVIGFMGTGDGSLTCGSDYIPGLGGTCAENYSLPANSVVVKLSVWDGPPTAHGAVDNITTGDALASAVTVGGYPAVMRTLPSGTAGDLVIEWTLTRPSFAEGSYVVTAHFKGPDVATLRAQVDALIKSISFAK